MSLNVRPDLTGGVFESAWVRAKKINVSLFLIA
jgi:hypothetical protein